MKLSVKTILVTVASLAALAAVLGAIAVGDLQRASRRHMEAYLELVLNQYIDQYPRRLARLLQTHGLDGVDSFVQAYQDEARIAAADTELGMETSIYVIEIAKEQPDTLEADGVLSHVHEHLPTEDLHEGVIHLDPVSSRFYVYQLFEEWNWVVAAIAPDSWVRTEVRGIIARTILSALMSVLVATGLLTIVFRRFLILPIEELAASARNLAEGRPWTVTDIEGRQDELGALARDLQKTASIIDDTQERLRGTNQNLEERIASRTRQLAQAVEAQKMLVREVHHRVKNNLSIILALLNFQKESLPEPPFVDALSTIQGRVRSMSLIHEQLYRAESLESVDAAEYLEGLAAFLRGSLTNQSCPIFISLEVQSIPLNLDTAIPCGLITNELVSNAAKHAFTGRKTGSVVIRFRQIDPQTLLLSVSDDGKGYDATLEADSTGIGRQLVEALVQQLGGTMKSDSGNGVTVTVTFPTSPGLSV